jgi:hypothetical protein
MSAAFAGRAAFTAQADRLAEKSFSHSSPERPSPGRSMLARVPISYGLSKPPVLTSVKPKPGPH